MPNGYRPPSNGFALSGKRAGTILICSYYVPILKEIKWSF